MSYLGITHLIALKESLSTMCGLEKEVEKNHNVSLTAQAAVSLESLMQIGRKKNKSLTHVDIFGFTSMTAIYCLF